MDSMGGILTKGLGANVTALIIGSFRLKFVTITVTTEMLVGGSKPLAPGEIQSWYKPVQQPGERLKHVSIKVTFHTGPFVGKEYSKDFLVSGKRADVVVKTVNFVDASKGKIKVAVAYLGGVDAKIRAKIFKLTDKMKVFVSNFKKVDDTDNHK